MTLPVDFLAEPATDIRIQRLDFLSLKLPEYVGLYAYVLDNCLTPEECQTLLRAVEHRASHTWERAMINVGSGRQAMAMDVRNCGRIIWDDSQVVAKIWKRVEHLLPDIARLENQGRVTGLGPVRRGEVWTLKRLNERMRFLKYEGGEYFKRTHDDDRARLVSHTDRDAAHYDGVYQTPDGSERSYFTLHLYLNGTLDDTQLATMQPEQRHVAMETSCKGGATPFFSEDEQIRCDIDPRPGRILIFQHRDLLHSGDDVLQGVKYTMRTDIMYERNHVPEEEGKNGEPRDAPIPKPKQALKANRSRRRYLVQKTS